MAGKPEKTGAPAVAGMAAGPGNRRAFADLLQQIHWPGTPVGWFCPQRGSDLSDLDEEKAMAEIDTTYLFPQQPAA